MEYPRQYIVGCPPRIRLREPRFVDVCTIGVLEGVPNRSATSCYARQRKAIRSGSNLFRGPSAGPTVT